MSEPEPGAGEERRVEELLRVNAALAAEVRSLSLGRTDAPRSTAMPTSRRLAVIVDERETAAANFEATRTHVANVEAQRDALERRNAELAAEVNRLRAGLRGSLRRVWARLLRN